MAITYHYKIKHESRPHLAEYETRFNYDNFSAHPRNSDCILALQETKYFEISHRGHDHHATGIATFRTRVLPAFSFQSE